MICQTCGGPVEWKGDWSNLTHTQCLKCGAINNQVVEHAEDEDEEEEETHTKDTP